MTALPILDDVAAAAEHCSYCAKLCRFMCPVAEETGRESVTPWGIDREITAAAKRGSVNRATADAVYACTGCRACGASCLPGLDLPTHVRAARAAVVDAGLAPDGADAACGVPTPVTGPLLDGATPGAELLIFPGCDSRDQTALAAVLLAAGVAWDVPREPVCCGARSVDVGFAELGRDQAAHATSALAGAGRIVAMDPHCARRLAVDLAQDVAKDVAQDVAKDVGLERVVTLPRFLAELAPSLPLRADVAPVVWHDPCWLGRGMREYDEAREVVRAASGADAVEPEHTGDRTRCTGGGMGFDQVFPETGRALREARAAGLRAAGAAFAAPPGSSTVDDRGGISRASSTVEHPGGPPVVTACPTAAARLADAGLDAHDLAGWLASRLADPPADHPEELSR